VSQQLIDKKMWKVYMSWCQLMFWAVWP